MHEHSHDHAGPEHAGHGHHHVDFESPEMAAHATLEAEVLIDLVTEATATLAALCAQHGVDVQRVIDVGSGPGVGTCALAERFPNAAVVAADGSATMLEHLRERTERLGLAARVQRRQIDLSTELGTLGRADLLWASMVLHHIGDEAAALRAIHGLLAPGGIVAVVERDEGPVRVLPPDADLGRPGLWDRLGVAMVAWFADMRADLPGAATSDTYPAMLEGAGFEVLADEALTVEIDAVDDQARRFARGQLVLARTQLSDHADPADLEALDLLIDEDSDQNVLRRGDVRIQATRRLYVGRAAGGS